MNKLILILALVLLAIPSSAEIEQYDGFPVSADYKIDSFIVVKDIDMDGFKEIIVTPENRMVKVFNHDGTLKWENAGGVSMHDYARIPLVRNLLGDDMLEVLTYGSPGYTDATYYLWDASGNKQKEIMVGKYLLVSAPAITKDGMILIGAAPGRSRSGVITQASGVHAFDMQGNKWYLELGTSVNFQTPSIPIGDIDGDGVDEAVILTHDINQAYPTDGKVHLIKVGIDSGSILWSKEVGGSTLSAAIGDLDGDSANEIVVLSSIGVNIFDKNGNVLHNFNINNPNLDNPVIGDIDGDGINEVVMASSRDKRIYIISDGILTSFSSIGRVTSNLAIDDVNGDGNLEILAGDLYKNMYLWDYMGNVLEHKKFGSDRFFTSATIADLDDDGNKELIMGNFNGNIHVYTYIAKVPIAPVAIITSPVNGLIYQLNSPIDFVSSSTDEDGTIDSYTWESDKDGIIGNTPSFSTLLSAGWHDITLTVTDNDGLSNTATTRIKINKPPVAKIHTPTNGRTFSQTDSVTFTGTGTDEDGNIILYQWTSDIDGVIQNVGVFTTSSLSVGYHIIPFTVTDNDGASDIELIQINQTGYDVNWNLKKKSVKGKLTMLASTSDNVYKTGSMVPIKFKISEDGEIIVDKTVEVSVYDPNDKKVFNAIYGNGSKSVRINEDDGQYITNFKSRRNDPAGTYRLEVTFKSLRPNQSFSKQITLLGQDTYFVNRFVTLKPVTMGQKLTYEWKLDDTVIGTERELSWIPDEAGIYNIQLTVTKNKKTITEEYTVVVNGEADSNGDDEINVLDLSLLGLNWGKSSLNTDFDDSADVNGDGVIDILDAVKIGKKWS